MIDLNRIGPEAQKQIIRKLSVQHQPKYKNQKEQRIIDGKTVTFDSRKEAARWDELLLLARAGEIFNLRRQPRYVLIPAQWIDGKLVEQPCVYVADFAYRTKDGAEIELSSMGEDEFELPRITTDDGNEITESDIGETVKTSEIEEMFTEEQMDEEESYSSDSLGYGDYNDGFDL